MVRSFKFGSLTRSSLVMLVSAALSVSFANSVFAQYTYVKSNNQTGNWDATARWTGGPAGTVPNAVGATATVDVPLSTAPTGNYNLQLSATAGTNITVGSLTINHDATNTFGIRIGANGNGTLTFQASEGAATVIENVGLPTDSTGGTSFFAPVTFASNIVYTQNHRLDNNNGTQFTSSANSAGGTTAAPGITFTKEGAGNVEFNVAPAGPGTGFQGAVVVNNGAVRQTANVFANASSVSVNNGGQFQLGSSTVTNWSLAPGAALTLNGPGKSVGVNPEGALRFQNNAAAASFDNPVTLASTSTVYVAANTAPVPPATATFGKLTLSQQVSGEGGLTKAGPGILELTQGNTYGGGTNVSGGTLLANNASGSATGAGPVSVGLGGVLGGSGTISGTVSIADGSLAPGNSPGTLTLGTTQLSSLSTLNYDLDTPNVIGGGVNDLTIVNGSLTLDGTLVVNALAGFGAGNYQLFQYNGQLINQGLDIAPLPGGLLGALDFSIPNAVYLTVAPVPEPSTWVLLATGSLGVGLLARRRKARRGQV